MPPTDYLAQCQLYADPEERILICCRCQYALTIANSQVTSHLREKHDVPEELRKGLAHYIKHVHPYTFRNPTQIRVRGDGSQIHTQLRLYDGFACRECAYRTINYSELSRHMSKNHLDGWHASRQRVDNLYDDVYLQTWTYGSSR